MDKMARNDPAHPTAWSLTHITARPGLCPTRFWVPPGMTAPDLPQCVTTLQGKRGSTRTLATCLKLQSCSFRQAASSPYSCMASFHPKWEISLWFLLGCLLRPGEAALPSQVKTPPPHLVQWGWHPPVQAAGTGTRLVQAGSAALILLASHVPAVCGNCGPAPKYLQFEVKNFCILQLLLSLTRNTL